MAHLTAGRDDEPPGTALGAKLSSLRQAIWSRRPILGEIMAKHGGKILYDYAQDFLDVNPAPLLDARKAELIATARELIARRLGPAVADGVAAQLSRRPLVSTTDHHGPIDHPFFVNANLVSALPYAQSNDPAPKYLVVFSFASVSVNNASAYPRGIEFHGGLNGSGNFIRLPILPDKLKMGVVYGTRAFSREDLTKAEAELSKKEKAGEIAAGRGDRVRQLLEECFGRPEVLATPDFAAQVTEINFHLWPRFFRTDPRLPSRVPDLVYLEIETLVTELLLRHHVPRPASLLHRLLFDPAWRAFTLQHFDGIPGAFSTAEGWGSFLFWAVDEKLHRVRLRLDGDTLVAPQRGYRFPLTPEGIAGALRRKQIFPGMLLCYLTVALFYGFKCLGGFCQVHDLTLTKEAWRKLLRAAGEGREADALEPVQTKELGGDGLVLAYLKTPTGTLVPATGIDLALKDLDCDYRQYEELSRRVTLEEMMEPMLPEMYRVLYSIEQRDPALAQLSPEEILEGNGLRRKLEPRAG